MTTGDLIRCELLACLAACAEYPDSAAAMMDLMQLRIDALIDQAVAERLAIARGVPDGAVVH